MIVKVQLPLYSTEKNPQALVYNKTRSIKMLVDVTPELLKWMSLGEELEPPEPKLFFKAHIKGDKLVLNDYAKWQEW